MWEMEKRRGGGECGVLLAWTAQFEWHEKDDGLPRSSTTWWDFCTSLQNSFASQPQTDFGQLAKRGSLGSILLSFRLLIISSKTYAWLVAQKPFISNHCSSASIAQSSRISNLDASDHLSVSAEYIGLLSLRRSESL